MKLRFLGLLLILVMSLSTGAKASGLLDFYFSIPDENASGVFITGEIIGLSDNATSAPTDILINSDPYNSAIIAPGYSLTAHSYGTDPSVDGTFIVLNGQIIGTGAGGLIWFTDQSPNTPEEPLSYRFNGYGDNGERNDLGQVILHGNGDGFAGATYTLVEPVPEPNEWGLGVLLFGASCLAVRRFSLRRSV